MDIERARGKVAAKFAATLESEDLGKKLEIVLWNHVLRTCQEDRIPLEWNTSHASSFRERYISKSIGLDLFNLRKNDALRRSVQDGSLGLKKFVAMKPWEMNPEMWAPIFERVAFKQLRKQLTIDAESAPDGLLQCRKCKSKKTQFIQMQTRSADEVRISWYDTRVLCHTCHVKLTVSAFFSRCSL